MSYACLLRVYASQMFKQRVGNRLEFVKQESGKCIERKVREERTGDLELSVWKLEEAPLYELKVSFNKTPGKGDGEEYSIRDITQQEMGNMCNSFKTLYEQIEESKGKGGAGGGCCG